jgi:PAS domain S-box-containing protein
MERDNKNKLIKLTAVTLLVITGLLVIWEFWIGEFLVSLLLQENSSKTIYDKGKFILICLFFISLGLLPFLKVTSELKWAKKAVKKSKDKEEKLNLINSSVMLIISKDGTIPQINQSGCQLTGFSKEQLIGKNFIDTCIPAKSKEKTINAFKILFSSASTSTKLQYTTSFLTKTQGERLLDWQISQLLDENGEIYGLISSGQDVTEKNQIEQKFHDIQKRHENELKNIATKLQDSKENYERETLRSSDSNEKLKLLLLLGNVFSTVTSANEKLPSDTNEVIWQTLKYFGEYSGASHGYISLFIDDNINMGTLTCGAPPQMNLCQTLKIRFH